MIESTYKENDTIMNMIGCRPADQLVIFTEGDPEKAFDWASRRLSSSRRDALKTFRALINNPAPVFRHSVTRLHVIRSR